MDTIMLGYFKYNKDGRDRAIINVISSDIPSDRGNGKFIKTFYTTPDKIPAGLKAGNVNVETDPWNSNILLSIKNI